MQAIDGQADGHGLVLVVGAAGRVAREVVAGLKGRANYRPSYATAPPAGHDQRWVRLDLLDPDTFAAALRGASAIFMMRPPQIAKARLIEPFLPAARRAGISRLVFLSVKGAESNPILPHHGMEQLIEKLGFAWTHIRPSDFMQNLETEHLASHRSSMATRLLGIVQPSLSHPVFQIDLDPRHLCCFACRRRASMMFEPTMATEQHR